MLDINKIFNKEEQLYLFLKNNNINYNKNRNVLKLEDLDYYIKVNKNDDFLVEYELADKKVEGDCIKEYKYFNQFKTDNLKYVLDVFYNFRNSLLTTM